jgi:hypothetical protein
MEGPVRAGYMEELRFLKRQQWAVIIAAITLTAGAFHMAQSVMPPPVGWEKTVATNILSFVAVGGVWLLYDLQRSLEATRKVLDPNDKNPFSRGMPIVF